MRRVNDRPTVFVAALLLLAAPFAGAPLALAQHIMTEGDDADRDAGGEREHEPVRVPIDELESVARATSSRAPVGARLSGRAPAPNAAQSIGGGPSVQSGPPPGLDWLELGPRPIANEYWSGSQPASGRVNSIAIDPRNGNVAYAAAAQGGVWRSADGGSTWAPLTEGLSSLASGAVALDPQFPDVVYYGTGEQNFSIDSFYGDGLFRSENDGAVWTKVASAGTVGSYISRVAVAPDNANVIYVASNFGVVVSADRGLSWSYPLGANWATDLVVDPTIPGTVYAAIRTMGVYKSLDHGVTWALLPGGLPTTGFDRINIAIAPSNPLVLYASFVGSSGTSSGKLLGMYRTADGGVTWAQLTTTPEYLGGQGWYDNCLAVKPSDATFCVAGGEYPYSASVKGIIKTTNAGVGWNDITLGGAVHAHPDQHCLVYGPSGVLWVGNDGGVFKTTNDGTSWIDCNTGLGITELYSVAKHPSDPTGIIGGTQDNGSVRYAGALSWPSLVSGDGGPVAYEKDNPSVMFSTYVYMNPLYKWTNTGSYLGDVTGGWSGMGDRVDWSNGPLVSDPQVPGTMYMGTYRVWRSGNAGGSWSPISGDLTAGGVLRSLAVGIGAPNTIWVGTSDGRVEVTTDGGATWFLRNAGLPNARIRDLALDPATPRGAWAIADRASSDRVYYTADGGVTWNTVTGNLPSGLRPLSMLVDVRTTPARLLVGTDYGVYVSTTGGATWIQANSGLPAVPVYQFALDTTNNAVFIATHGRGMWKATPDIAGPALALNVPNGGETWTGGVPQNITWAAADPAGVDSVNILWSTNGGASFDSVLARGVPNTGTFAWTPPDTLLLNNRVRIVAYDAWRNPTADTSATDFALVRPVGIGDALAGLVGFALSPAWPNPSRGAVSLRYVAPRAARIALSVYNLAGRRVRMLVDPSSATAVGTHDVVWDGRDASGRAAPAGVYFARLAVDGAARTARFALVH